MRLNRPKAVAVLMTTMLVWATATGGCGKSDSTPAPGAQPAQTGASPIQVFLQSARDELTARNDMNERLWKIKEAKLLGNANSGTLVFTNPDGLGIVAGAQVIGAYDTTNSTWTWAWAISPNNIQPALTEFSQRTRAFGQQNNLGDLTNAQFKCDQNACWSLVAIASKVNNGMGAFVGSNGPLVIFMLFNDIKVMRADQLPATQPSSQPTTDQSAIMKVEPSTMPQPQAAPLPSAPGVSPALPPAPTTSGR